MTIKVWDYLAEYDSEKTEIMAAVEKVFSSGRLILGQNVQDFESEFSKYCDVRFGVGVNSGTDALFLALKAIGVAQGDEVITVANTAVPTVSAIVSSGARPVFVDIDPATYLMDTAQLEDAVTPRTKCIMPVHLFGQCVNMAAVQKVAQAHGLKVIEDCAQSHGAMFKSKKAGSLSDLAAFSFYPTKILGGFGDGGMVITDNQEYYERLKRLRFYGMETAYYSKEHGYNSRLDELHAAILLSKLKHLDGYIARRRELAKKYDELLKNSGLVLPTTADDNFHAYYLYVCRHAKRDQIIAGLKQRDIVVNISYPWPIHTMTGYEFLGYKSGDLPQTEAVCKEVFSLPMYPALTDNELGSVVSALIEILRDII
ncbi:DegT/DnrJ/EryC1/StrS family aminotransferase [Candidatus Saganbacteria bacterium]|nr:DegT/DnrJ/EryC1/StrS family aminotransferase [Candidatus Saganbacteria bacterium]